MSSYKEVSYRFDMIAVRLKLSSKLIGILRCQRYNISKKKPAFYILSKKNLLTFLCVKRKVSYPFDGHFWPSKDTLLSPSEGVAI
jgi:hypothetical protein